jgi:tRNA (mo5U34)-methyltransferase
MQADSLRRRADAITWWHGGMDLGHGVATIGRTHPARTLLPRLGLPDDLTGKTVLDVGTWDGYMAFECERRGASVVAVDNYAWDTANVDDTHNPTGRAGFDLAHEALGSKVIAVECPVLDMTPQQFGRFDIVLFLGVLYHMRHPLLALERVAALTRDLLIVETHTDANDNPEPYMRFYPGDECSHDVSNWWGPNLPCVEAMMASAGMRKTQHISSAHGRVVVHGWING